MSYRYSGYENKPSVTDHAVEQFIRRWEPTKNFASAKTNLLILVSSCKSTGKTPHGDQIKISGLRPEIRMVVKDGNVCVTVLPPENVNCDFDEEFESQFSDNYYKNRIKILVEDVEKIDEETKSLREKTKDLNTKRGKITSEIAQLQRCMNKTTV